jgi:hypothetical protein
MLDGRPAFGVEALEGAIYGRPDRFAGLEISSAFGYDFLSRYRDNDASSHAIITSLSIGAFKWP